MATFFDQHFAGFGITQAQFRVLLTITEEGGLSGIAPSVLADHLLIERATISVLTNRMAERGLLARLPGENRRTFNLVLTEAGQALLQELIPPALRLAEETLQGIHSEQLREMRAALEVLEKHLRDQNAN